MATSALRLRPIATPRTTAISITRTVAISVIASVIIVSFQSPVAEDDRLAHHRDRRPGASRRGRRRRASSTSAITHQGESPIRSWSGLIRPLGDVVLEPDGERVDAAHEPVGELVDVAGQLDDR